MEQMVMQLVIAEDIVKKNLVSPQRFERYQINDYFDRAKNHTARIHYDDGFMALSLPVVLGELEVCSLSKTGLKLAKLHDKNSIIQFNSSFQLTSLQVNGRRLSGSGNRRVWSSRSGKKSGSSSAMIVPERGKAEIEICDLDFKGWKGKKKCNPNAGIHLQDLIGQTIQVAARIPDDWIYTILTVPFEVHDLEVRGSTFRLKGAHGAELIYKGFVGVRAPEEDNLIIDIRDTKGHMTRSLHLWCAAARYF